ncbi:MAG: tRNA 2-thiocytidine biosynthesis TtcA family protein [Bacillota bacterium]
MIAPRDHIAVGVSGGKDSLALLYALVHFQRVSPVRFTLTAITVDMGWQQDYSEISRFCHQLGVQHTVVPSLIAPVVFCIRNEPNPCSLCAKLRRGTLNSAAKKAGANKVALAHHLDDAVETMIMSMFFEGRVTTFWPVTHLDRTGLTVIRPLVYVPEHLTVQLQKVISLPVLATLCPVAGKTSRHCVKQALAPLRADRLTDQTLQKAMAKYWASQPQQPCKE